MLIGIAVLILMSVDGHQAEATLEASFRVAHGGIIVGATPCSLDGHIGLTIAHGLIGYALQVVVG